MQPNAEASDSIPLTFCPQCEVTVVTYRELGPDDTLLVCCMLCHHSLGLDGEVEEFLGDASLLSALGIGVEEVRPKGGAGGCRTKGGSCGCSKSKSKTPSSKKGFQA